MQLEIEMGKLKRHQYALALMRRRIRMIMAGQDGYWGNLERLLKTGNPKNCPQTQTRSSHEIQKLRALMEAYHELKKEETDIIRSIHQIDDAFFRKRNQLINQNRRNHRQQAFNSRQDQHQKQNTTHYILAKGAKGAKLNPKAQKLASQRRKSANSAKEKACKSPIIRDFPARKTNAYVSLITELGSAQKPIRTYESPESKDKLKKTIKQKLRARLQQQKENFICRY